MQRMAAIPSPDSTERLAAESTSSPREDDLATIVYTSGTTGHSKGVMLTHGNLVSDAKATVVISGIRGDDRLLSILPLPHTYECTLGLITPVLVGASVSYLDKPPTAPVLLPALATVQPTIMLSVPLIIEKIYKAKILPRANSKSAPSTPVCASVLQTAAQQGRREEASEDFRRTSQALYHRRRSTCS